MVNSDKYQEEKWNEKDFKKGEVLDKVARTRLKFLPQEDGNDWLGLHSLKTKPESHMENGKT